MCPIYECGCWRSPVIRLDGLGVRDLGPLIPVLRLGVVLIIHLFGRVDWRNHIVQQVPTAHTGLIDEHLVAVVWVQDCQGRREKAEFENM